MMKKFVVIALAMLAAGSARADGLFMGLNWATSNAQVITIVPSEAKETGGYVSPKTLAASVNVPFRGKRFAGITAFDGVCDGLQQKSNQNDGFAAHLSVQPTNVLYTSGRTRCDGVSYPGFTFFFGAPNMALAPAWGGDVSVPVYYDPSSFFYRADSRMGGG